MASVRHVVVQGECLSSIAYRYGFADALAIYEHADNADLRRLRPSPHLLHPGDVVVIPERRLSVRQLPTGRNHTIVVKLPRRLVRVRVVDALGEPMRNLAFTLTVGDQTCEGTSDGDGIVEQHVPARASHAVLVIGDLTIPLAIGHLNPARDTSDDGVSGIQARLRNLGYRPGPVDGRLGSKTRAALRAFQRARRLDETGQPTDETLRALADAHGC